MLLLVLLPIHLVGPCPGDTISKLRLAPPTQGFLITTTGQPPRDVLSVAVPSAPSSPPLDSAAAANTSPGSDNARLRLPTMRLRRINDSQTLGATPEDRMRIITEMKRLVHMIKPNVRRSPAQAAVVRVQLPQHVRLKGLVVLQRVPVSALFGTVM